MSRQSFSNSQHELDLLLSTKSLPRLDRRFHLLSHGRPSRRISVSLAAFGASPAISNVIGGFDGELVRAVLISAPAAGFFAKWSLISSLRKSSSSQCATSSGKISSGALISSSSSKVGP